MQDSRRGFLRRQEKMQRQSSARFIGSALVAAGSVLLALAAGRCLRFAPRRSRPGARGVATCDWGASAVIMVLVLGGSLAVLALHLHDKQVHADLLEQSLLLLPPGLFVLGDLQQGDGKQAVAS